MTSVIAGTASNTGNGDDGVDLSNTSGSGSVEVRDSTFTYNSDEGLYATSDSDITLVNVTSNSNGGDGAYLDNSSGGGDDNIFVVKSVFSSNGDDGLEAHSNDDITLINVTAQGNNNDGAYLATSTSSGDMVTICGGLFTGQSGSGDYNVQVSGGNTRTRSSDLAPYTNWSGSWTNIANGTGACNFLDTDSDQVPDQWDTDDDNDGVLDTADSCPGTPGHQAWMSR